MSKCRRFDDFMAEQQAELQRAIDENKWYLSERKGEDVGYPTATAHFMEEHLDRFAQDFRESFCQFRCPSRAECDLVNRISKMVSSQQMVTELNS